MYRQVSLFNAGCALPVDDIAALAAAGATGLPAMEMRAGAVAGEPP